MLKTTDENPEIMCEKQYRISDCYNRCVLQKIRC